MSREQFPAGAVERRTVRAVKKTDPQVSEVRETVLDLERPIFPKPSAVPTGFPDDILPTDVDELNLDEEDPFIRDRQEVMAALDAIELLEDENSEDAEWEKRSNLIRLINYIAEQQAGHNLAMQGRRMIELLDIVPENEPIDPDTQKMIMDLSRTWLKKARESAKVA